MTARDMTEAIGKECSVDVVLGSASVIIWATIQDARVSYGRLDYLVEPVAGKGQAWVSAERVQVIVPDLGNMGYEEG